MAVDCPDIRKYFTIIPPVLQETFCENSPLPGCCSRSMGQGHKRHPFAKVPLGICDIGYSCHASLLKSPQARKSSYTLRSVEMRFWRTASSSTMTMTVSRYWLIGSVSVLSAGRAAA